MSGLGGVVGVRLWTDTCSIYEGAMTLGGIKGRGTKSLLVLGRDTSDTINTRGRLSHHQGCAYLSRVCPPSRVICPASSLLESNWANSKQLLSRFNGRFLQTRKANFTPRGNVRGASNVEGTITLDGDHRQGACRSPQPRTSNGNRRHWMDASLGTGPLP